MNDGRVLSAAKLIQWVGKKKRETSEKRLLRSDNVGDKFKLGWFRERMLCVVCSSGGS